MSMLLILIITVAVLVFLVAIPIVICVTTTKRSKKSNSTPQINSNEDARCTMKFCSNCGSEIHDNAIVCIKCGCAVSSHTAGHAFQEPDVQSAGLNVLSFFFPIIGLILYITFNHNAPTKAKGIGKWALIGFILSICLSLFSAIIVGLS